MGLPVLTPGADTAPRPDSQASDLRRNAVADDRHVQGFCPVCGSESLFLGSGGYVTCGWIECKRPTAVSDLLDDRETEHVVQFDENEFTVRHPLHERLDDALMDCKLHAYLSHRGGPPVALGRYRARLDGLTWTWERL